MFHDTLVRHILVQSKGTFNPEAQARILGLMVDCVLSVTSHGHFILSGQLCLHTHPEALHSSPPSPPPPSPMVHSPRPPGLPGTTVVTSHSILKVNFQKVNPFTSLSYLKPFNSFSVPKSSLSQDPQGSTCSPFSPDLLHIPLAHQAPNILPFLLFLEQSMLIFTLGPLYLLFLLPGTLCSQIIRCSSRGSSPPRQASLITQLGQPPQTSSPTHHHFISFITCTFTKHYAVYSLSPPHLAVDSHL